MKLYCEIPHWGELSNIKFQMFPFEELSQFGL